MSGSVFKSGKNTRILQMSQHVYIEDIHKYEGQQVTLQGWLYNRRSSKKLHFLQVRDGAGIIQAVVFKPEVSEELWNACDTLNQEASIIVTGTVRKDERSPLGYELAASDVRVLQNTPDFPISPKDHGADFLLKNRHLWLRSRRQFHILRIRATLIKAIRDYFDERGFLLMDTPIFTPAACEGTTTLFGTPYFDLGMAYLTQSGQLYNEATCAAFGRTYCFGPVFRAEKSKTRRHLTEFWMVEPEVAYFSHEQNLDLAEDFIVDIVRKVLEKNRKDLEGLERDVKPLENVTKPLYRISYTQAVEQLNKLGSPIKWGDDFGAEDETLLTQQYDKPIMVEKYPAEAKAFYMKHDAQDERLALCVDVLAPEGYGEVIGGGAREDDLEKIVAALHKHQLPLEAFEWYLDLRRWGSVPHAGFGLGLERTVAWICGLHHVRETIPFPRLMERIAP
jgi:asparaginyl-tRNA synthetase